MSTPTDMLVQNEAARDWVDRFSLEAGRNAASGKPADYTGNSIVFNAVTRTNKAVAEAVDLSKRLARDESKTVPMQHEAAERVVSQRIAIIEDAETVLKVKAQKSYVQAEELVREAFAPDPNKVFVDFMLHQHINKLATTNENGIPLIRDAITADIDVARVLYSSKSYLIGIAGGVLEDLKRYAVKVHVPGAKTLFDNCDKLVELATRYPKLRSDMKRNLFNQSFADRARART